MSVSGHVQSAGKCFIHICPSVSLLNCWLAISILNCNYIIAFFPVQSADAERVVVSVKDLLVSTGLHQITEKQLEKVLFDVLDKYVFILCYHYCPI